MLPFASVSAALHSIIPAPVLSRSCLTCSAVIFAIVAISISLRHHHEGHERKSGQPAVTGDVFRLRVLRGRSVTPGKEEPIQDRTKKAPASGRRLISGLPGPTRRLA